MLSLQNIKGAFSQAAWKVYSPLAPYVDRAQNRLDPYIKPAREFVERNPYSTWALANIVGDSGYLGYALYSDQGIGLEKTLGAALTFPAHILMLAVGDNKDKEESEKGWTAKTIHNFREASVNLLEKTGIKKRIGDWAMPLSFTMLAANGAGLLSDGIKNFMLSGSIAMAPQIALGFILVVGLSSFAYKEYVNRIAIPRLESNKESYDQKEYELLHSTLKRRADKAHRFGARLLGGATVSNAGLAVCTGNPFVIGLTGVFLVSNYAMSKTFPKRSVAEQPTVTPTPTP